MKSNRRGRVIRWLGWSIGGLATFFAILVLLFVSYIIFFDYPEQLRQSLEDELSRVAGAPASIRSVHLDFPRFAFELRGISIAPQDAEQPVLALERVWGQLRVTDILRLHLHWTELVVDGLSLHLVEREEGGLALPLDTVPSAPLASSGVALSADKISFENAALVLRNQEVPWQLEASNLSLSISRERGARYHGRLSYEDGLLRIKENRDIRGSVSADFHLMSRELHLSELEAESAVGKLLARGKLSFAGGVRGRFDIDAEGDAGRTAQTIFGIDTGEAVFSGPLIFRGALTVEPDNRSLEGTLIWRRGRLAGISVSDWSGDVVWDRSLLQIRDARGAVASGTAKLSLHQSLPVAGHKASLELELDGARLQEVVRQTGELRGTVDSIVSGKGSFRFHTEAPERVSGSFELEGVPARGAPEGSPTPMPLAFQARGLLREGDVAIEEAEFESRALVGSLSGVYPREGPADLVIELEASDLSATARLRWALRRLLRTDEEPASGSWPIAGQARAEGRLRGRFPFPSFDGELEAEALRFGDVRFESLQTRGTLSRERFAFEDLVARDGEGALAGRGSVSLVAPQAQPDFAVEVRLSRWPARKLADLAGTPVEIGGALTGDLSVHRRAGGFEGAASLTLEEGTLLGEPFARAEAELALKGRTVQLRTLSLSRGRARLDGELAFDIDTDVVTGWLATESFPLERIEIAGLVVDGAIEGRVEIAGPVGAPAATLTGRGRDLRLNDVPIGEAFLTGDVRERILRLDVTFEKEASEVALEAAYRLDRDRLIRGRLRWRELDGVPWLRRAWEGLPESVRVLSNGEASFETRMGAASPFEDLVAEATLAQVVFESDRYRFVSLAPAELSLRSGRLELATLELQEGRSRVELGGVLDVDEGSLDFQADGIVSLSVLESFYPELATTGNVDLSARISGSFERPSLTGFADFKGGSLRVEDFPQALGGLRGRLVFGNRAVRIPELRGVFGSGPVTISGVISLEGLKPSSVDLKLQGSQWRLRYPEGLVATIDADLALLGGLEEQVLTGRIVLQDAVWSREYDLVSGILSDREHLPLFDELEDEELFRNLRFDVAIAAPGSLKVRNALAAIDATAELELRGSVEQPVLLGTTVAERGEVFFLGQRYNITSGKVDFVDPTKVEPFIDLIAETRVRSYRIELRLTGTTDRFHPELSSDPPLRTVDILRLLAGATEREILIGNEEEELAGVGVASLLTERLTQEVGKRAERLFGLDRFSIDPFLVGRFANPTARVSLGKQITRELSVNYSSNLNATTEAIILIEYTPEGPMSWILSRDEEGDIGIDVKFRKSF